MNTQKRITLGCRHCKHGKVHLTRFGLTCFCGKFKAYRAIGNRICSMFESNKPRR